MLIPVLTRVESDIVLTVHTLCGLGVGSSLGICMSKLTRD